MTRPAFLDDIRRIGAIGWSAYACDRALSSIFAGRVRFTALWFYAQPVDRIPTIAPRAGDRMQVRVIDPGEVPEEAFGRPAGAVAERFALGGVCVAALKDSELAGFMWLQFDVLSEHLFRCDFVPVPHGRTAWDFDLFVAPDFRLSRAFARLWSHARDYLSERGIDTTVSWIAFDNVASQRAHRRMGAVRVGWAIVLSAGPAQFVLSTAKPYLGASLRTSRARLIVRAH